MSGKQSLPILLVVLLIVVCSCNDDDSPTNGGHHTVGQLPSQIGMLWKYQVYDSLTQATDTVWVSVTEGRPSIPDLTVFVWKIYWTTRDSVVLRNVVFRGDTVEFYTDTTQTEPDLIEWFVFPLELGREWVLPYGVDTSRVAEVGAIGVPAGVFTSAARVERLWDTDFEGGGNWSTTWVTANVGVVSRRFLSKVNPGGGEEVTMNQTWKLYDYDLSTFSLSRFPNAIGTEWVYQLVDTLIDLVDTVTVRVIGKIQAPPYDSVMIWAFEGREYLDTMFVAVDGEWIVEFFDTLAVMPFVSWSHEFPMAVGRHWGIETFAPIPQVYDKGPAWTPAGNLGSGFHYRMGGGFFNDYWLVEDVLVPGVGMAKRKFTRWGLGPVADQEWTLLSYQPAR